MFDATSSFFADEQSQIASYAPPLQQTAAYAKALGLLSVPTRCVMRGDTPVWLIERRMPLLGRVALCTRGLPRMDRTVAADLRHLSGARHLIVNAENRRSAAALAASGYWRLAKPKWIAELDTRADGDVLLRRMHQKWRNRLRHAKRQTLTVTRRALPATRRHWLYQADARQAQLKGYQPLPVPLLAAIAASSSDALQLFVASQGSKPVAAMLFIHHGTAATYQIGWSTDEGRRTSAGNLLMWQAMLTLKGIGVTRIDLGLADPQRAPDLCRFKRGSGASARPLGGTWISSAALPSRPLLGAHRRPAAFFSPQPSARAARGPRARPESPAQ